MAGLLAVAAGAGVARAERVGVTAAVSPRADGAMPGSALAPLVAGSDVAYQERIVTGAAGATHILFLDRSSLNVGPDSEVVIDEFVYAPKAGAGRITIDAAKGVLRYVGGVLSKNDEAVTVRTPTAVIGIRGGIAVIDVSPTATRAYFLFGHSLTVTGASGEVVHITRPGFFADAIGGHVAPPAAIPAGALSGALAKLTVTGAGTGGSKAGAKVVVKPVKVVVKAPPKPPPPPPKPTTATSTKKK